MGEQMSIFDIISDDGLYPWQKKIAEDVVSGRLTLEDFINPPEPLCYSCEHGIRRGAFRLCRKGGKGYKRLGQYCECKLYRLQDSN